MRTVDLTGPKGYSHGWVFHGVPGVTPHSELLRMRKEARAAHPPGHPERLKAERAVRHSRKQGATQKAATGEREPTLSDLRPGSSANVRAAQDQLKQHQAAKRKRSTKAERLLNAEFTQTEKNVYAPVTPGEGPRHPARQEEEKLIWHAKTMHSGFDNAHELPHEELLRAHEDDHWNGDVSHPESSRKILSGAERARPENPVEGDTYTSPGGVTERYVNGAWHQTTSNIPPRPTRRRGAAYWRSRGPNLANDRDAVELSAETPRLVATPAPLGKPGGPGLYHLKGAKLPNYIENMRNALMRGGMSEGRATATAISRCKVLAATSKHPEVKAAAAAAIAELKATAARAKASHANEPANVVELFNPYHAPPGTGGGQFISKSGGSGAAAPAKGKISTPSGMRTSGAAQKAGIMRQVSGLRKRIASQTIQLNGLRAQRSSLSASVGGSKATGTTKAKKAAKTATAKSKTTVKQKAGAKRKATSKSTGAASKRAVAMGQIARLSTRISALSATIRNERGQVRTLLAKARTL